MEDEEEELTSKVDSIINLHELSSPKQTISLKEGESESPTKKKGKHTRVIINAYCTMYDVVKKVARKVMNFKV